MNPEDSDVSSHVLDRFDLCAYSPESDEKQRRAIIDRNVSFSDDPERFSALYDEEETEERKKVERGTKIIPLVTISDELINVISELCIKVGADGLRGDLAMINCAKSGHSLNSLAEFSGEVLVIELGETVLVPEESADHGHGGLGDA